MSLIKIISVKSMKNMGKCGKAIYGSSLNSWLIFVSRLYSNMRGNKRAFVYVHAFINHPFDGKWVEGSCCCCYYSELWWNRGVRRRDRNEWIDEKTRETWEQSKGYRQEKWVRAKKDDTKGGQKRKKIGRNEVARGRGNGGERGAAALEDRGWWRNRRKKRSAVNSRGNRGPSVMLVPPCVVKDPHENGS